MKDLLDDVIKIAREAGKAIIEIYNSDEFEVENKDDKGYISPLTQADKASHEVIQAGLSNISEYPIISEEGAQDFQTADKFWLVDPMDGTKEFISRNGEFTVNIALVENGQPVLGVVYAPALNTLYASADGKAFKIDSRDNKTELKPDPSKRDTPKIVVSRNHKGEQLAEILSQFGPHEETDVGSSLKFCYLAEGKAQAYPRFVPTYLWDTAAADAVLRATGGQIRSLDGNNLVYEPGENIKNPFFIATASGQEYLFDKFV
ncbi:MAG TPA: 3'(2'),5'-bisphosphate nucleotidase CysQ [Candidatus Saccharimonadales bacterium]|nr:3'(2'),5'-bisphosphate nucleotidase CysQ [Candidatus Saccharimonadales bacterium]